MKMQTTLEFVILLSAAASLSLFVISTYSHIANQQKPLYMELANQSANVPSGVSPRNISSAPSMVLSIANVSYVNRSNSLEAILTSPGGYAISSVHVTGAPSVAVIPDAYYNISTEGFAVLSFSIVPKSVGTVKLSAVAELSSPNNTTESNGYTETYAIEPGSNAPVYQNPGFSASLIKRNESILYNLSSGAGVYTASMWDRCSWMDWGYHQLPIQYQCGNANWYFFTFDSWCYWNHGDAYRTHCVKLYPTNTTSSQIQDSQSYSYNTALVLSNNTLRLGSNLTNYRNVSTLSSDSGGAYGNASVESVSGIGPQPYSEYVVLNTSGAERAVNLSYYSAYSQELANLEAQMSAYNNSDGDPSTAQQYIDALNSEAQGLIGSPAAHDQYCGVTTQPNRSYYSCKPLSGLYYVINASINQSLYNSSQSIPVQGSTVNVR